MGGPGIRLEVILIVLALLALAGLYVIPWVIRVYNRLVGGRNQVQEAWANIEVQLNRRYELIPNLVNTVKGYAKHEDAVFTQVAEARSRAEAAGSPEARAKSERALSASLLSLYAVAEAYPELKASGNFSNLQQQLVEIENAIQRTRTDYNAVVRQYNTAIQTFPTNLLAGLFRFGAQQFYNAPGEADTAAPANFS